MSELDFERLDADQIRIVIRLLNAITGNTNSKLLELIEGAGGPHVPVNSVSKRKAFPGGFAKHLELVCKTLSPRNQAFIVDNVGSSNNTEIDIAYSEIGPRLAYSVDQWLKYEDIVATKFMETNANSNGRYLIMRSPDGARLTLSRMNIAWRKGSQMLLPGFVTRRIGAEGTVKTTRGVAFMLGESVYTAGRVSGDTALRFTRLRKVSRGRSTDLYGVRLGTSASTERPYAHLVYAYQLRTIRDAALKRLMATTDLDDPFLDEQIENMQQIRRLLSFPEPMENGLQTQPLEAG